MSEFVCVAAWVSVGWVPSIGWWTSQWLLIWRTLTLLLSAVWYKAAYYWPSQLSRVHYYLSTVDWLTSSKVCGTRYPEGDTVGGDANREEYLFVVSVDFNRSYCSVAKLLSPNSLVQLQNEPQICKWNLMDSWIYFQRFTDAKKYIVYWIIWQIKPTLQMRGKRVLSAWRWPQSGLKFNAWSHLEKVHLNYRRIKNNLTFCTNIGDILHVQT